MYSCIDEIACSRAESDLVKTTLSSLGVCCIVLYKAKRRSHPERPSTQLYTQNAPVLISPSV